MTTVTAQRVSQLIGKCRNGHVVRGESRMGAIVATTEGATTSGNCWFHCPCGAPAVIKYMKVQMVAERACNGVCMGATGPSCSCSCGGENHGSSMAFSS